MGRIEVSASSATYPVLSGLGALQELPGMLREMGVTRAAMVTDENVARHWGEVAEAALTGLGVPVDTVVVPAGEGAKTYDEWRRVLGCFEAWGLDRQAVVIALGGGTVGDLAGFAAACWLRGVRVVQVPTTLLAMVDSSIGGKTGINGGRAKNAIGAIWQPVAVVADLAALSTLPDDEYLSAFAEVVKYAVIMDAPLAGTLRDLYARLLRRDPAALETVVDACAADKARVVAEDERERGPRQLLNYGHTVGHGIEAATGYTASHGRAVAAGMRAAARIGVRMRTCAATFPDTQEELLRLFGLPGALPPWDPERVLAATARDKKATAGEVAWVLPREMGKAQVGIRVPADVVREAVLELAAA